MAINFNAPSQVRPYANLAAFPVTGVVKTVYIAEDTNKIYRWTGSAYVELSETDAITWGSITGTLSAQTDLQTALDAKFDEPTGNATQYLDGAGAPTTFPTALPPSGTAGGDLTGTYPNPTVHRIHGIDVQNGTPSADDVLVYGGSPAKWQHQHLNASQVDNDSSVTGTSVKLALEHLDSTKVPTTRTLTINGTTQDLSADRTFTISTGITIGTTAITSGTVGRVLFEGTGNVVQESANLFWDNTNGRLGIGTSSPTQDISITKSSAAAGAVGMGIRNNTATAQSFLSVLNDLGEYGALEIFGSTWASSSQQRKATFTSSGNNGFGIILYNSTSTANFSISTTTTQTERFRLFGATGNVVLQNGGTFTDAGYKLDVNGTARVSGTLTVASTALLGLSLIRTGTSGVAQQIYNSNSITYFGADSLAGGSLFTGGLPYASFFGSGANYPTQFASNNAVRMTIFAGGNVAINTTTDVASSLLTMESTTKGFLPPRQTQAQRTAIASPAVGLVVFQTDATEGLYVYKSTGWALLL